MVFRNPQRRKKGYDYAQNGYYFITICTKYRYPWFGKILDGNVVLSNCGTIVKNQWEWLAKQHKYVRLDEFVVMPDHFHAVLQIDNDTVREHGVDAVRERHLQPHTQSHHKTAGRIIGAFKTTSSKMIHITGHSLFSWQRSFHDRIIRNDIELYKIRAYIRNNPSKG
ncbi:MAG: transposase [Candidatus Margulisiibacteriota bacterium]